MKNEQQRDQNAGNQQDQTNRKVNNVASSVPNNQRNQRSETGNEKSNISVNNEGRISQEDKWSNNGSNNRNEAQINNRHQERQVKSDKTVTEPEIDAPIYDPEKTEKKIPRMGNNGKK